MNSHQIKQLQLYGIVINPALNDGNNGLLRVEANQWIRDGNGNVTDVKHRLEAADFSHAFDELSKRANHILTCSKGEQS